MLRSHFWAIFVIPLVKNAYVVFSIFQTQTPKVQNRKQFSLPRSYIALTPGNLLLESDQQKVIGSRRRTLLRIFPLLSSDSNFSD
jgi:hypothetical protein